MPLTEIRTQVCILGGGPSALLSHIFLQQNGVDSTLVADRLFGMLTPTHRDGLRFTTIPIFLNADSELFGRMMGEAPWEADTLHVSYSEFVERGGRPPIKPGSHADFLMRARSEESAFALTMAVKHLGPIIYERTFPELESKVRSHYCNGVTPPTRVGFTDGVSPYVPYIERNLSGIDPPEITKRVDWQERCVLTSRRRIVYDRLISTIALVRFLNLAGICSTMRAEAGGGQFFIFETDARVTPNRLIYDSDSLSPVYRTFAPRPEIIIAQVAMSHWYGPPEPLARRLQSLFGLGDMPHPIRRFTVDECYPLSVSDYSLKAMIVECLRRAGVTLFGRFAEWQYRDLEELNWAAIL